MQAVGAGGLRHADRAERVELVANPARHVEHALEGHALGRIEIEGAVVGELGMLHAREPRILRDRGELRRVEQRLQVAADDLRPLFDDADDGGADAGRHLGRAMLIERLARRRRWEIASSPAADRHRRQHERRDLDVVAEQVALRQLLLRPEDLVQVGDLQAVAVGQLEDAVLACLFERRELVQHVRGDPPPSLGVRAGFDVPSTLDSSPSCRPPR